MADHMNEIAVKFPDKWKDIGRGLGLEEHELTQIRVQEQSTNDFFSAMFNKWRNGEWGYTNCGSVWLKNYLPVIASESSNSVSIVFKLCVAVHKLLPV